MLSFGGAFDTVFTAAGIDVIRTGFCLAASHAGHGLPLHPPHAESGA